MAPTKPFYCLINMIRGGMNVYERIIYPRYETFDKMTRAN